MMTMTDNTKCVCVGEVTVISIVVSPVVNDNSSITITNIYYVPTGQLPFPPIKVERL